MLEKKDKGNYGEDLAIAMLLNKGYLILERNWRVKKLEIDIIAQLGQILVIIEVKTRGTRAFGDPASMVSQKQRLSIIKAANYYILEKDIYNEVRFDIVSVFYYGDGAEVDHIPEAFFPIVNKIKL
jgi:putative endonuclease